MTCKGKVVCTFIVLPCKPRFQTETWIRAITQESPNEAFLLFRKLGPDKWRYLPFLTFPDLLKGGGGGGGGADPTKKLLDNFR